MIAELIKPNGVTITYEYDDLLRLIFLRSIDPEPLLFHMSAHSRIIIALSIVHPAGFWIDPFAGIKTRWNRSGLRSLYVRSHHYV
jgi:hypothetical protein